MKIILIHKETGQILKTAGGKTITFRDAEHAEGFRDTMSVSIHYKVGWKNVTGPIIK
jgi:hypothetical protein